MSFYGLNRSAFNGGVSGIIAGAALIASVSGFAGDGTRWVMPDATASAVSTVAASSVRTAYGEGGFVGASTGSALPGLLQLHSANIVVASSLVATNTDAWALATGSTTAAGFITRPGTGISTGVSAATADPLVTVGYRSDITVTSGFSADASVKLNGQSTTQRDGYVNLMSVSGYTTADGLKTALGYATAVTTSSCTTDSIKTHGGAANMPAVWAVSAIASTDAAYPEAFSYMTAKGYIIAGGEAVATLVAGMTVAETNTTQGVANVSAGVSVMAANGRLAVLAGSAMEVTSLVTASAEIYRPGTAVITATSDMTAQWALLVFSSANLVAISTCTALASTNAEAPDPEERTMYRPFTERAMVRPFVDREMRRSA